MAATRESFRPTTPSLNIPCSTISCSKIKKGEPGCFPASTRRSPASPISRYTKETRDRIPRHQTAGPPSPLPSRHYALYSAQTFEHGESGNMKRSVEATGEQKSGGESSKRNATQGRTELLRIGLPRGVRFAVVLVGCNTTRCATNSRVGARSDRRRTHGGGRSCRWRERGPSCSCSAAGALHRDHRSGWSLYDSRHCIRSIHRNCPAPRPSANRPGCCRRG